MRGRVLNRQRCFFASRSRLRTGFLEAQRTEGIRHVCPVHFISVDVVERVRRPLHVRKMNFIAVFQYIVGIQVVLIDAGRCAVEHRTVDKCAPDTVGSLAEIIVTRLAASLRPEVGKCGASRQRHFSDLRLVPLRVCHPRSLWTRKACNPQMQIIRKGERNRNVTRNRRQTICRRQERSCPRSVLLGIIAAHVLGNLMVRGIVYSSLAGIFKRCPAFVRVLAAVFRHGILFGKCLNGAQIDFAFLNGIFAYKLAIPKIGCKLVCLVLICRKVFSEICCAGCFVEQQIKVVLRFIACCAEL